jgi:hypothetical protein
VEDDALDHPGEVLDGSGRAVEEAGLVHGDRVRQESGFGIRDSGFRIRDSGFGIREPGVGSRALTAFLERC